MLVSLSQAVTPGLFRAARAKEAAAAPLTPSFPLPGSLQAVSSARPEPLLRGESRLGGSRFCSYKVFLWAEAAAGPPDPPRPRRPRGWGGGGGSKNSSRSPAEGPGGRRLAKREDPPPPRGGSGEKEGKERTAAPVLLSPPPGPPLHIGVPAPPAGGWLLSLGPPLIHSEARCYGSGRVEEAAAWWGTRPAPLGAAPAPGSRMCRCGWDPLPTRWGSLAPRPGTRQKLRPFLSVFSPQSS